MLKKNWSIYKLEIGNKVSNGATAGVFSERRFAQLEPSYWSSDVKNKLPLDTEESTTPGYRKLRLALAR
jgi:hypothetical protein